VLRFRALVPSPGRFQLRPLRIPAFRWLFVATLASSFGTLLAAVALAVDVKDRTQSGLWVGALLIVEFLPAIVIGLVAGPLVDRLSRRGLMIGADLARSAVFFALPFVPSAGAIVVLAAVAGIATGFFRPAVMAGMPNLVPEEELPQANSLLQSVENVSWAAGPVLGGLLAGTAGPSAAYWLNAVSFLASGLLIARIPSRLLQAAAAASRGHWRDLADGLMLVVRSRPLLTVLVVWSVAVFGTGAINVGEIFLAKDTLNGGDLGYGLLFGAIGTGLAVGSFVAGGLEPRLGIGKLYCGSIAIMAAGFALAALSPNVWVAAACCVVGGAGNGAAGVCNVLLVQRGAPDSMRGRAFTVVMSANFVALTVGMAAAGPFVDAHGARATWVAAAALLGLASLTAIVLTRGLAAAEPAAVPTPGRGARPGRPRPAETRPST
jgi:MFS family permease